MFSSVAKSRNEFPEDRREFLQDDDSAGLGHDQLGETVRINVGGKRYETYAKTLGKFPNTLLGNPVRRRLYFNSKTGEYFFDRHRTAFESILYFYQSGGNLLRPQNIPVHIFIQELQFFDVGDLVIQNIQVEAGLKEIEEVREIPKYKLFGVIWEFLEYPDSSRLAKVFAITSLLVISFSLVMFVIETLPEFSTQIIMINGTKVEVKSKHEAWSFKANTAVIAWFTVEFLFRLLTCPNKIKFVCGLLNVIDLLSIMPYYISLVLQSSNSSSLSILRVVRVIRVLRVFKLSRHSRGLQILGNTLKASTHELFMLAFFLFVVILIFGSCAYYAEFGTENNKFTSIPAAFWWAIVTMTTVGYGDMYPRTLWGQLVGGMAVVCGVLTIALPVPVVVSNFEFFYSKEKNRLKMEESKRDAERRKQEAERSKRSVVNHEVAPVKLSLYQRLLRLIHVNSKEAESNLLDDHGKTGANGDAVNMNSNESCQYSTTV